MKILFLSSMPLIKYGLKSGFDQLGHTTDFMYDDYSLYGKTKSEQEKLLSKKLENFHADIIFTEGYAECAMEEFHQICKSKSIPLFVWSIEDPLLTSWYGKFLSENSDHTFTTAEECIPFYESLGKKSSLLLFGCNPEFHKYIEKKPDEHEIVLVASNYSNRYEEANWFLMPLLEKGYKVEIWGTWWDDFSRPVSLKNHMTNYRGMLAYEYLPNVYSQSKVILGMNCDDTSETQTSMRPFETLGVGGGLLVSHYTKAMNNIFGEYCYLPKNTQETFDMVNEVLSMKDEQRKEKALKAQKYVYENHNYKLRAEQIINAYRGLQMEIRL